jgi:hypothetical protein
MRKSHECHSEPKAKNLTITAPCKCEILRLPPQDDIATQSLLGRGQGEGKRLERFERSEAIKQSEAVERFERSE